MATLEGPWVNNGRIVLEYSATRVLENTQAQYTMLWYYETRFRITDVYNTWVVSGTFGTHKGSNVAINHGASGGRTLITKIVGTTKLANIAVAASMSNMEAQGGTVGSGEFKITNISLAPTVSSFNHVGITSSGFTADLTGADGANGTLNNVRVRYTTNPNDFANALITTAGSYKDVVVTGLTGGTTYYYNMAVSNNTFGWGPWASMYKSFTTLPGTHVRVAGVWRNANAFVKVAGTWRPAERWVKVNGVWRR